MFVTLFPIMEECEYKEVLTDAGEEINADTNNTWKPLLRQCMVCAGLWCNYFMQGMFLGAPTVMVAQIRREANSTEAVTDELSSWLSSMPVMSAVPFVIILPWLCYRIGRKFTYMFVCGLVIIGSIIFYSGTNLYHVLIAQLFLGPSVGAINTFTPIIISEYTSPKYRGIFLTLKSASVFWGIWVSNAIGTFYDWKNIAAVALICSVYLITVFAWPESPYWLAMKGRYAESAKSHRWLKGVSESSEKELAEIFNSQKNTTKIHSIRDVEDRQCFSCFSSAWSTFTSRSFYKPLLICIMLLAQHQFTGKIVISIYAIEVLKKLTQDESVAYRGMLILDGVTVFSMYGGCVLSRYFKRRTLLLLCSSTGIVFLYIMSCYSYLVKLSIVKENSVLIIIILIAFSIPIGCGPMILASSIYGEIVPSRYHTTMLTICGLYISVVFSILLKISPFMFRYFKMHGCFLFFAIASTVITIFHYFYLPETKDKTMQEIEEYFTKNIKTPDKTLQP